MNRQTFYILLVLVACFSMAFAAKDGDPKEEMEKPAGATTPKGAADIFSTLGALTTAAVLYVL